MTHRSDIQALRGVAVLAVVLYHVGALPGGFRGVDAFFVVSGFVIGSRLKEELAGSGRIDVRRFFGRRIMRLAPALVVLLLVVSALGGLLTPIGASGTSRRTGLAALVGGGNIFLEWAGNGYHDVDSNRNPLLHTWSLGVEEQFYLLAPFALWLAHRFRVLTVGIVCVAGLSLALWMALSSGVDVLWLDGGPRTSFYSVFTRAWEFAIGVALTSVSKTASLPGRLAGGFALAISFWVGEDTLLATLLAAGATGSLLVFGRQTAEFRVSSMLEWLGDLSYSWYLWHWPLIVWWGATIPTAGSARWIPAAISLAPAVLSYRFVESRFRDQPFRGAVVPLGMAASFAAVLFLLQPITLEATDELQAFRFDTRAHLDATAGCRGTLLSEVVGTTCHFNSDGEGLVVLLGDSNAGHFTEPVLDAAEAQDLQLLVSTASACPPVLIEFVVGRSAWDGCRQRVERNLATAVELSPDIIVLGSAAGLYVESDEFALSSGSEAINDPDAKATELTEGLVRTIEALSATDARIVIPLPLPRHENWDVRYCSPVRLFADQASCERTTPATDVAGYNQRATEAIRAAAAGNANVHVLNLEQVFCDASLCRTRSGDGWLYRDGGHLTIRGAMETRNGFLAAMSRGHG